MGAAIQTMSEVRGFRPTRYLASANGVLGGRSTFTAQVLFRMLGLSNVDEHIVGNVNGTTGWSLTRAADTDNGGVANFAFTVYENNTAHTLTFNMPMVLGLEIVITCQYVGGTPGVQRAWVNGVPAAFQTTSNNAISLSSGAFSIGYDLNNTGSAAPEIGFFGFGFTTAALTQSEVEENYTATLKAQDITPTGLGTAWTNVYSTARSCGDGIPTTWDNFGTGSATQTLTATGRALLVLGTPPAAWSGALGSSGGSGPGVVVTDVYLSKANGNDANDGLTPATAKQTFAGIWELLPAAQTERFVVHIDGGAAATLETDYVWETPPVNTQTSDEAFILLVGDGAGQSTHDGFYQVATGTVAAGAFLIGTINIAPVAVNAYRYFTIEMTSGDAAGFRSLIVENTATVIYTAGCFIGEDGFSKTVAPGDTYRIVRPNVCIDFTASTIVDQGLALNNAGQRVHMVNMAMTDDSFRSMRIYATKSMLFGVEGRGAAMATFTPINSVIACGEAIDLYGADWLARYSTAEVNVQIRLIQTALGVTQGGAWRGWGVSLLVNGGNWQYQMTGTFDDSLIIGYFTGGVINNWGARAIFLHGFSLLQLSNEESTATLTYESQNASGGYGPPAADFHAVLDNRNDPTFLNPLLYTRNAANLSFSAQGLGKVRVFAGADATIVFGVYNGGVFSAGGNSWDIAGGTLFTIVDGQVLFDQTNINITVDTGVTFSIAAAVASLGTIVGGKVAITNSLISSCSLVASAGGLVCSQGAELDIGVDATITGTVSGGVAVQMTQPGTKLNHTAGVLTINNASTGAASSGVQIDSGAQYYGLGGANDAITTSGGSGNRYGMIVKGASQGLFSAQPTGVVGATNDFLVDATAAADTVLNASLSVQTGTASRIARTT